MLALEVADRIGVLRIDRAANRNAFDHAAWESLSALLGAVAEGDVRALVVESAVPGSFCSGSDLKALTALKDEADARAGFRIAMVGALEALAALRIPTIAAVAGGCYGAGVALMLACDVAIAGPDARFAITPAKLGLVYPRGDVARLTASVGPAQAIRLLCAGIAIEPAEAARIGLVHQLAEDAGDSARAFAATIAANAPGSVRALKAMVRRPGDFGDAMLDRCFDDRLLTPAFAEGLAAFRERRPPDFADEASGLD